MENNLRIGTLVKYLDKIPKEDYGSVGMILVMDQKCYAGLTTVGVSRPEGITYDRIRNYHWWMFDKLYTHFVKI